MSCYQKSSFDSMVYVSIIGLDKQCEVYFQTLKVQESWQKMRWPVLLQCKCGNKGKIQKKVLVLKPNRFWIHHAILMLPKDIKKKIKKKSNFDEFEMIFKSNRILWYFQ